MEVSIFKESTFLNRIWNCRILLRMLQFKNSWSVGRVQDSLRNAVSELSLIYRLLIGFYNQKLMSTVSESPIKKGVNQVFEKYDLNNDGKLSK